MLHDRSVEYKQKSLNRAPPSLLDISNFDNGIHQGSSLFLPGQSASSLSTFAVIPERKVEPANSQNCDCFELQARLNELTEQLAKKEAEILRLEAKIHSLLRAPMKDGSGQYAANSPSNETSLHTRLLEGAFIKRRPGMCKVLILLSR